MPGDTAPALCQLIPYDIESHVSGSSKNQSHSPNKVVSKRTGLTKTYSGFSIKQINSTEQTLLLNIGNKFVLPESLKPDWLKFNAEKDKEDEIMKQSEQE